MVFKKLDSTSWNQLDKTGDPHTGFQSKYITTHDSETSQLHIFVDENEIYHFAIADDAVDEIFDPRVNGLSVNINKYRLSESKDQKFLDLSCSLNAYLDEFTEIVREISEKILINEQNPKSAVSDVINSWKSFWDKKQKEILSDEEQIGLLCELRVLQLLCQRGDPTWALGTWKGPLGEKYDFVLSDQVIEVKGTRRDHRIHTINGIDQLYPPKEKSLQLISFLASKTNNKTSLCLPDVINKVEVSSLHNNAANILKFRKLLAGTGYSPIYKENYKDHLFDIYDGASFLVNENFPKLTVNNLNGPLSSRITNIKYQIDLSGYPSQAIDDFKI